MSRRANICQIHRRSQSRCWRANKSLLQAAARPLPSSRLILLKREPAQRGPETPLPAPAAAAAASQTTASTCSFKTGPFGTHTSRRCRFSTCPDTGWRPVRRFGCLHFEKCTRVSSIKYEHGGPRLHTKPLQGGKEGLEHSRQTRTTWSRTC